MYRAVTLKALENDTDVNDKKKMETLVKNLDIDVEYKNNDFKIYADGVDITKQIRTEQVDNNVSAVAQIKSVRDELVNKQRSIAQKKDIVMDGRDIGTRVLTDAKYKFYITASVEERARRRYKDVVKRGEKDKTFKEVKEEIIKRDRIDSNRKYSPLKMADDAVEIDTTELSKQEVLEKILSIIRGE
jgi:cytidylate kinase